MSAMTNARITRAPLAVATASYTTPPPSSGTIQETLANASFVGNGVSP